MLFLHHAASLNRSWPILLRAVERFRYAFHLLYSLCLIFLYHCPSCMLIVRNIADSSMLVPHGIHVQIGARFSTRFLRVMAEEGRSPSTYRVATDPNHLECWRALTSFRLKHYSWQWRSRVVRRLI
jgi:hypothetical protein